MYNTGWSLSGIIAPALLTTVVVGWGRPGWILFAVAFAVTGAAVPFAVCRAHRTRVEHSAGMNRRRESPASRLSI